MNTIHVIDAPCGAGKSSFAIQMINQHPEQRFIYCAPFLDELDRIKRFTAPGRFAAAADGQATKIIIPSEIQGIAGLAKGLAESVTDAAKGAGKTADHIHD